MADLHSGAPIVAPAIRVDPSNISGHDQSSNVPGHDHSSHIPSRDHMESINKMSRFPVSMQEFCEERNYIVPEAVAIGPYYHGKEKLREMEGVKNAAAHYLFGLTDQDLKPAYMKVFDVARNARDCYDADALQGISIGAFASMMFHDACFLLLTILVLTKPIECSSSLLRQIDANISVFLRDIFLLENQIPWIVLEALMDMRQVVLVMNIRQVDLPMFIVTMGKYFQSHLHHNESPLELGGYKPPHLLGLFHFYQSGHEFTCRESAINPIVETCLTSAIELTEIGIKLTCSKTAVLKKIKLRNMMILFPKLSLPSLRLNEKTACWLLNMAAFETCTASHDCTVGSYLALLAMLMDREEDVHELRSKHLIHGEFTNKQVLDFFKGRQASNICPGLKFYDILKRLESYRHKWWIWINIYRFFYKNIKRILTVLSVAGVLAAILKATPLLKSIS